MGPKKNGGSKRWDLSRRQFIVMSASSSIAAGLAVPLIGNTFVDDGLRRNCWNTIRDDRTTPDGFRPIVVPQEVDEAFPKLAIHHITYNPDTPAMNHCKVLQFVIENVGMTVASPVFVEMLEANRMASSFEEMALNPVDLKSECFRRDIWGPGIIYPGCWKAMSLIFKREFPRGQAVALCYDSIKDPRRFPNGVGIGVPHNRKLSGSGAYSPGDPHLFYYTDASQGTGGEPC